MKPRPLPNYLRLSQLPFPGIAGGGGGARRRRGDEKLSGRGRGAGAGGRTDPSHRFDRKDAGAGVSRLVANRTKRMRHLSTADQTDSKKAGFHSAAPPSGNFNTFKTFLSSTHRVLFIGCVIRKSLSSESFDNVFFFQLVNTPNIVSKVF